MGAKRFAHRVPDERGAVLHVSGRPLELRVGQQHEPGTEGGPVVVVGQAHLRRRCGDCAQRQAERGENSEDWVRAHGMTGEAKSV